MRLFFVGKVSYLGCVLFNSRCVFWQVCVISIKDKATGIFLQLEKEFSRSGFP